MPNHAPRSPRHSDRGLNRWGSRLQGARRFTYSSRFGAHMLLFFFPLGIWLGRGGVEKAVLVGSLFLVLSAEILNSAIEVVVDKTTPEFHELAGRAKDMGSAAVFVLMINVFLCWSLILWQHAAG